MVAPGRYIPTLMAVGSVLAAYRLLGVADWFKELIKNELQPVYDYVIGKYRMTSRALYSLGTSFSAASFSFKLSVIPPADRYACLFFKCTDEELWIQTIAELLCSMQ